MAVASINRRLSEREKAFVPLFVLLKNGTQAAIQAGYSRARAGKTAYELLQDHAVKREIAKERARVYAENKERIQDLVTDLVNIAGRSIRDFVDEAGKPIELHLLKPEAASCIESYDSLLTKDGDIVEVPKFSDKLKAMDMAFKLVGAYAPEKKQVLNATVPLEAFYEPPEGAKQPDIIDEVLLLSDEGETEVSNGQKAQTKGATRSTRKGVGNRKKKSKGTDSKNQ